MARERGMALPLALIALVVVGALVAGAFFAGTQEQRIAESDRRLRRAFGHAEVAIGREIAGWVPARYNGVAVRAIPDQMMGGGTYGGRVVRLTPTLFFIDVTARDSGGAADVRQRIGLVVRIAPLDMDIQAALTAVRGARLTGNVRVDGTDQTPIGWPDCAAPDTALAGLWVNGPAVVSADARLQGTPPVVSDTSLSDGTITSYGNASYDDLAERATVKLPGGEYRTYPAPPEGMPIVHLGGDAVLSGAGGPGRGILLVDGDLTLTGSFEFFGVIIVRGRIVALGEGEGDVRIWGAALAREVQFELSGPGAGLSVTYSKCLITQSLRLTGRIEPIASRAWGQLF